MIVSHITAQEISRNDEDRWNRLLLPSPNASYRQCMPYEYACVAERRDVCTFVFQRDEEDIAGAHYVIKRSPGNTISTADVVSGFVFREEPKAEVLSILLGHFMNWANERKASYARITPWLPKSIKGEETPYATWVPKEFKSAGYNPIESGRHTYWIDLSMNEDDLLARMRKQARYNIRKASRKGMKIEIHEKPSNSLFESFWHLYSKLAKHKKLDDFMTKQRIRLDVIPMMDSGLGVLYFAKCGSKAVNVTFASNFGQAASLHSGMDPDVVKDKECPSPGHLLRWEIIRDLKRRGNKIHDMGFCPNPVPTKDHPLYGIWYFKHSFGGDHVDFLPTYGKVLRPLSGRMFWYLKYRASIW